MLVKKWISMSAIEKIHGPKKVQIHQISIEDESIHSIISSIYATVISNRFKHLLVCYE